MSAEPKKIDVAKLKALHNVANRLLGRIAGLEAVRNGGFAVNWARVRCFSAEVFVDHEGDTGLRVWIAAASPDNGLFCQMFSARLAAEGWPDVEVRTEW